MVEKEIDEYFPARPALTPVFLCAASFWALCAVGYASGSARAVQESMTLAMAGGAACLVAVLIVVVQSKKASGTAPGMSGRVRFLGILIAAAAVGFSLGCAQAAHIVQNGAMLDGCSGTAEIVLLEDSSNNGFGENALVSARLENGATATFSARFGDVGPLLAGERCSGTAKVSIIDYSVNPFAWSDGSCGTLKVSSFESCNAPFPFDALIGFRKRAIEAIGDADDSHRLLQALVCGYRRGIRDTEMYAQFQTCGLAHLVAVSGAHLVIVTGLFAALLRRLKAPRRLSVVLIVAVMLAYYVVAGMPVSALRATIMSALGLLAFFGRRRPSSLNAVGIGIFALVLANPATCVSASFALSALSTMGIVLFSPLFQAWLERVLPLRFSFVIDGLSLTFAANLLSQLYACSMFSQLPLVSPIANILTAPLFPLSCGLGLAFALVASAPGAPAVLGGIASLLAGGLSGVVGLLSRIPYASVPFSIEAYPALALSAVAAFLLWAAWPRDARKAVAVCGAALAVPLAFSFLFVDCADSIVALDVGQGDSILVRSRGRTLLIDTGEQDTQLLEQLGLNHVTHLDAVLITHADDDHCGSLDALRKAVQVDRVILAAGMSACEGESERSLVREAELMGGEVVSVSQGDVLEVGAFSGRVIWPAQFTEEGGNANSLCLLLEYDGNGDGSVDFKALMAGDAEKAELAQMIEKGLVGDIDLLKVGHHGSRNGSTSDEMRTLRPEVALISCGAHNRYGHPTQEILDQLDAVGATTFRTDQNGAIRCEFTSDRISVTCAS